MMQNHGPKNIERYRLIDLKQLSARLSLSVPTLRNLKKRGMPHYSIDRKILVNPGEVFQWLEKNFKRPPHKNVGELDRIINHALAEIEGQLP